MTAGGAETFQQCWEYFLQCSKFASIRPQIQILGLQSWFLHQAPFILVMSLGAASLGAPKAPQSKFGALVFEPDVFWKQMHFTGESICDIVGTLRRTLQSFGAPSSDLTPPQWFGSRGFVPPLQPPRHALGIMQIYSRITDCIAGV